MKIFKYFSVLLAAGLISCGGGGGSPGTTPGGTAATVANFDYVFDKSSISNSGGDTATLTATALDSNNNPVAGVDFKVTLSSGIYTPTNTKTDSTGKAVGVISTGGDKSNRTINLTMSVGGKTKTDVINVTGSDISISTVPAAPSPGASVVLTAKVVDVTGAGISNIPVVLGGSLGFKGTVNTDSTGTATATLASAPSVVGVYTVTSNASGVTKSRDIQVIGATGSVPDAVGTISAASLSITPNSIAPNLTGGTTNKAALKALFQDSSNRAIKNVRVRFEIVEPSLGAGEQISTGSATVYSDQNGVATADYIAGSRSSPTNGVVIRACYALNDAGIANGACTQFKTATMTVANAPLSITLGDNNLLEAGANKLTYIKKFDVAVADSAGNAVSNAQISASVDLRNYFKAPGLTSTNNQVNYDGSRFTCLNEDTNRNGLLDAGEDVNGNGTLEPRKADVIISYVGGQVTGSNGRATIQVEYPQSVAYWLEYAVKVTTNVAGSEGLVEKTYITEALEADFPNGSFRKPAYGQLGCDSPN